MEIRKGAQVNGQQKEIKRTIDDDA